MSASPATVKGGVSKLLWSNLHYSPVLDARHTIASVLNRGLVVVSVVSLTIINLVQITFVMTVRLVFCLVKATEEKRVVPQLFMVLGCS